MKKFAICLLTVMVLCSSCCYAIPTLNKKETVYINLKEYGDVDEINVYNKCEVNGADTIKDYTNYTSITNLTNRENFQRESGEIIWNVSGEKTFSYTGKVSSGYYDKLPWNFNIIYKLNGVEVKEEELLGASGLVEINIKVNANENANSYYRNNYILEVTSSYDMTEYLSVSSDEAMITDTGNTKTLMFIVLPGKSTEFTIKLGSDNFSMDGITMAAVPLTGDILDAISDLVEEKNDIKDSLDSIDISTDIILNALNGMNTGLTGISEGVSEIKKGTEELHSISNLRDEDIENLKLILNELLPVVQNFQDDLEKIDLDYDEFIEVYEKINVETKKLEDEISSLNANLEEIADISKGLPNDVEDINELVESMAKLTKDLNSILKNLDDSETKKEVSENLISLGEDAQNLAELAQTVDSPEVQIALISSAKSIGATAKNIKAIFENISLTQIDGKETLSKDLTNLQKRLYDIEDILEKDDAKTVRDFINDLSETSNTLEDMLNIVSDYSDNLLESSGDIKETINNAKCLAEELNKMDTLSISMSENIQTMLKILSSSIYNGTDKTTVAIVSLNNELINITKQSNQFKNSKNQIKNVIENKWDKVEEETTLFNVDKEAKVVSFGNEKNENVESVQFIFKTPDIKKVKEAEKDLEAKSEKITFWDRVKNVLNKMFGWLKRK